ncbi:hypothetical protein SAMN04487761_1559 [Lachnospiraceae bacterium C7]|nr:hypothetical protein SAMN04487761_1559 [Lachnospiraceae bacterium C7]
MINFIYTRYFTLSPITMSFLSRQRMYRNAFVSDMTIIVFACIIGAFFRRNKNNKVILAWNLCAAFSLSYFYYLREDSIWIMPFVLVITILNIIYILFLSEEKNKISKKKIGRIVIYIIPIVVLVLSTLSIKTINYKKYGIFEVNDRSSSYFADVMSDLYKIDAKNESKTVWISKDAVNIALKNSSTLRSMEPELKDSIKIWGGGQEIKGDLISWSIRQAASNKGLYKDAKTANDFWKNVHLELKEASKKGKIKNKSRIYFTKQATGIKGSEIPKYTKLTIENMGKISRYEECEMKAELPLFPSASEIRKYEVNYGVFAQLDLGAVDQKTISTSNFSKFINKVIKKYQACAKVVNIVAILMYVVLTVYVIWQFINKKYKYLDSWLVTTGVVLSSFVLIFGVTFFTSWFSKDMEAYIRPFYSVGGYSLIQVSKYLSIIFAGAVFFDIIKKNISSRMPVEKAK